MRKVWINMYSLALKYYIQIISSISTNPGIGKAKKQNKSKRAGVITQYQTRGRINYLEREKYTYKNKRTIIPNKHNK